MKVVIEPNEWQSYWTNMGTLIENVHDYGEVEFDDSFANMMRSLKRD